MGNAPLRKIVRWVEVVFCGIKVQRQLLECGHTKVEGRDIYGPTNADRRRCNKCKMGRPIEFDPTTGEPLTAGAAK